MRLLTLNLRLGAGGGVLARPAYDVPASEERDAALAGAIQAAASDVAALQEVRNARHAEKIARRLAMSFLYAPHPSSYSLNFFEWGVALLYRFPLVGHGNFTVFFDPDVRTGRNGLWAEFKGPGGLFSVMNVHLEARRPAAQIERLAERAARIEGPLALMGDFNLAPDDEVLTPLNDKLTDTCRAVHTPGCREAEADGTLMGDRRRIDQIWVTTGGFRVRDAGLVPSRHRGVSDHVGYFADLEVIA